MRKKRGKEKTQRNINVRVHTQKRLNSQREKYQGEDFCKSRERKLPGQNSRQQCQAALNKPSKIHTKQDPTALATRSLVI